MIMGVDHVALACTDIDQADAQLTGTGFRTRFIQRDVPNFPGKTGLLDTFCSLHTVAFCEGAGSTAIELTSHGPELAPVRAGYEVLLRLPQNAIWRQLEAAGDIAETWGSAFGLREVRCGAWDESGARFWLEPGGDDPAASVVGLLVPVTDLDQSEVFWRSGLGLRSVTRGEAGGRAWARGRFISPIPAWCLDVVLMESRDPLPRPVLDAPGFPCLALLSTDARKDEERLLQSGGSDSTGLFEVGIDGKKLQVVVLRAPGGELVELIQVSRPPKK